MTSKSGFERPQNDPSDRTRQGPAWGPAGGLSGGSFARSFWASRGRFKGKIGNLSGKKDGKRNDNVRRSWMNQAIVSFYTLVVFLSVL